MRLSMTVVVTAYLAQETVMETIESVLSQRRLPDQVGLVVGTGADRTADYASFYEEEFDFVESVSNVNRLDRGYSRLCLRALDSLNTSHVMFLPPESFLYRDALEILDETVSDDHDLLSGALTVLPPEGPEKGLAPVSELSVEELLEHGPVHQGTQLWRVSFLEGIRSQLDDVRCGPFTTMGWLIVASQQDPVYRALEGPLLETWSSIQGPHCWTRPVYRALENLETLYHRSLRDPWEPLCSWVSEVMGETGGAPSQQFLQDHAPGTEMSREDSRPGGSGVAPGWIRENLGFFE